LTIYEQRKDSHIKTSDQQVIDVGEMHHLCIPSRVHDPTKDVKGDPALVGIERRSGGKAGLDMESNLSGETAVDLDMDEDVWS